MKRTVKVALSFILAIALLLTDLTSFSALAADNTKASKASVKSIKVMKDNGKKAGKLTCYADDVNPHIQVAYTWIKTASMNAASVNVGVDVATSDRSVIKVAGTVSTNTIEGKTDRKGNTKMTTIQTVSLNAVGNGSAVITVSDKFNYNKKKVIKVNVKTHVNSIISNTLSGNSISMNGVYVAGTKGAVKSLGIVTNGDASNNKLKYTVVPADGYKGYFKVSKGSVKIKKNVSASASKPVYIGSVFVTAKDGNAAYKTDKKNKTKGYEVKVFATAAVTQNKLSVAIDGGSKKDFGMLLKGYKLNMKSSVQSPYHTYQIKPENADASQLSFVSSNTKVAKVSATGKITAVGNGKARITVIPKLGNKGKVVIKVNVTTNADIITLPHGKKFTLTANGKDKVMIDARVNQGASKTKLKYEIVSVVKEDGYSITDKAAKKYVKVSKKGVVKAKKACTATIRVYAANNTDGYTVENFVTVTAVAAAKDVKLSLTSVSANGVVGDTVSANKAVTVTIKGNGADTYKLDATVSGNTTVTWKSSKPSVADVTQEGLIVPHKNGKAVITATANDNSGKKAKLKVTVKTAAYNIFVPDSKYIGVAEDGMAVYQKAVKAAKKYSAKKVIGAKTNADASNKKVSYSTSKINFTDNKASVIVSSVDGASKVRVDLILVGADNEAGSNNVKETVSYNGIYTESIQGATDGVKIYAGTKLQLTANCVVVDGSDKQVVNKKTTWKSDNKKVAKVNKSGVVKGVKPGIATITATNKKTGATATFKVYVGAKKDAVQKEYNNLISNVVNSENRTWMGANTKFDAKRNMFSVDIVSYDRDILSLSDTGATELVKKLYNNANCTPVSIKADDNKGNYAIIGVTGEVNEIGYEDYSYTLVNRSGISDVNNLSMDVHQAPRFDETLSSYDWSLVKAGNVVTASRNDGIKIILDLDTKKCEINGDDIIDAGVYDNIDDATKAILDVLGYKDDFDFYRSLANWNGYFGEANVTVKYVVNGVSMEYTFFYTLGVTMGEKVYDAMMDSRVQNAMDAILASADESLAIDSATQYVADKNEFEIVANKNVAIDKTFFENLKESFNKNIEDGTTASQYLDIFYADITEIKYTVRSVDGEKLGEKNKTGVKTKGDKTPSEFFNEVFDAYTNDILDLGVKDYAGCGDIISGFYVTCKVGDSEYQLYYEARFTLGENKPTLSGNALY